MLTIARSSEFPVTADVVTLFTTDDFDARWCMTSGCIAIVDHETQLVINDAMPIRRTRDDAERCARDMMRAY